MFTFNFFSCNFYFRSECTITITNNSQYPVELLEITMQSILDLEVQAQTFQWNKESLMSELPLQPGSVCSFTVNIHATADFLSPPMDGKYIYIFFIPFYF